MTLDEYASAVRDTLQYWLDIHTDNCRWAEGWACDDDWQYLIEYNEGRIRNSYFEFDVLSACLELMAEDSTNEYNKCDNCGFVRCADWDDCDCEIETDQDDDEHKTEHTYSDVTPEELLEFWGDCGMSPDIPDEIIEKAMVTKGFETYTEALEDTIAPVVSEVKNVIEALDNAGYDYETVAAIAWANHTMHVNGNIVEDYGHRFGIDYDMVDRISQEGIASVFPEIDLKPA
jgi:hypothetical protein